MTEAVYIIATNHGGATCGPVKVGVSRDPEARLRALQTACPYPLILVSIRECKSRTEARAIERAFHESYPGIRLKGEWFDMPDPHEAARYLSVIEREDGLTI